MAKRQPKPPLLLEGCRITHYAIRDRSVKFGGRTNLFVNGKELGSVPRLAIGESRQGEFVLFHCGRAWNVRGTEESDRLSELKRSIERVYPGISKKWLRTGVSKRQAEAYRKRMWRGLACSFCRRLPDEFDSMIERHRVRICNICVREFNDKLRPD